MKVFMTRSITTALIAGLSLAPALAHFGILIPASDYLDPGTSDRISLAMAFGHPAEGSLLGGQAPSAAGVVVDGDHQQLTSQLHAQEDEDGQSWWSLSYTINQPGNHIFYANLPAYWEPAEDSYIMHLNKTIVAVGDSGDDWADLLGSDIAVAEIVPLIQPTGLFAGHSFRGQLIYQGQPVAHAEVEIERCHWRNLSTTTLIYPTPLHEQQVVLTDEQGIFTVSLPTAGWWGIAGLVEDEHQEAISGKALSIDHPEHGAKSVEVGAVLWLQAYQSVTE